MRWVCSEVKAVSEINSLLFNVLVCCNYLMDRDLAWLEASNSITLRR